MTKKLLFIAPDYYGFSKVVLNGLQTYGNFDVNYIASNLKWKYKSLSQHLHNCWSKTIFHKNLKQLWRDQYLMQLIDQQEAYDILLINAPYLLSDLVISYALKKAKKSIFFLWDSIEKIPMQKQYIDRFDKVYSFDKDDCEQYGLSLITNFYFAESNQRETRFDVAYLATCDKRMEDTKCVLEEIERENHTIKASIFLSKAYKRMPSMPQQVKVIREIIPFDRAYQFYLDSKAILDISHHNQRGLSFRPFEAIGLRKKLITTNENIIHYDFYRPNNVYVIKDLKNFQIPSDFFSSDFEELDDAIREKYHLRSWIQNITTV